MTNSEPLRALTVNDVPLWDAKVHNILTELRAWIDDRDAAPIIKRDAVTSLVMQLELLVYQLDEGKWPEGVLAEPSEPDTQNLPATKLSEWERAALEFDRMARERLPELYGEVPVR